jgi:hypothetical protein
VILYDQYLDFRGIIAKQMIGKYFFGLMMTII